MSDLLNPANLIVLTVIAVGMFFGLRRIAASTHGKSCCSDGAPIPIEGSNDFRRDREGNVIVTRLNEAMCQEIAKVGNGIYVRVDNSNSAQKAINQEINKMAKSDVESKVYTEYNEQFQVIAWMILLLLLVEMLILDRKNPLFKNIRLFSNK